VAWYTPHYKFNKGRDYPEGDVKSATLSYPWRSLEEEPAE